MEVFRLSVSEFADLSGLGGLYGSGRWHNKGRPVIYTAGSRSLSALERFVHEQSSVQPKLRMMTIWLPDDITIIRYTAKELPLGWDLLPDGHESRDLGSNWLATGNTLALQVPSAIVADEYNLLLNPAHPDIARVKIVEVKDYFYDKRLQKMIR